MLIDSHCHLHLMEYTDLHDHIQQVLTEAQSNGVGHVLSVCVELSEVPLLYAIAASDSRVSISVGAHPNTVMSDEPTADDLSVLAQHSACIAIGETGLDYYRTESEEGKLVQIERFREHIRAARHTSKPLIIHTRQAAEDTLRVMKEEKAYEIGGVMHCFSEDWDIAQRALDLNFYISFSGIVTFKNAHIIQSVAKKVPFDRILIETDAPYLAPVPFRGKPNRPAWVKYVAEYLSELRGVDFDSLAAQTTLNFSHCFHLD